MNTVVLKDLSIGYTQKGNEKVVAQGLNAAIRGVGKTLYQKIHNVEIFCARSLPSSLHWVAT